METILAIDYGKRKIGLAYADSYLATPYSVLRVISDRDAVAKILSVVEKENITLIIIGLPVGDIAEEIKKFKHLLGKNTHVRIEFQDETLTTKMAQHLSKEAGLKRKKRKLNEDAYAAALILQEYLDSVL